MPSDLIRELLSAVFAVVPRNVQDYSVPQVYAASEPGTWVLMILGFCGIGFITYRRRKVAPA